MLPSISPNRGTSAKLTENEPAVYTGIGHYDLTQGVRVDNKLKHAATDYVKWTSQAATLKAEGRCHDGDPQETTRVSSKAWGAQIIEAEATREDVVA